METIKIQNDTRIVPSIVSIPEGNGPFPAVVMNHGHGANKEQHGGFIRIMDSFKKEGILSISMDFPGCGESKDSFTENYLSNMISDSNAGLKYIIDNYNIDTKNLGILGYSMGGRIATSIVGGDDNPYKAIALLAPSVDDGEDLMIGMIGGKDKYERLKEILLESDVDSFPNPLIEGESISKEWITQMSESYPLRNIEKFKGDMLVIHGDKDTVVDLSISEYLIKAYKDADMKIIKGADHSFDFSENNSNTLEQVIETVTKFFKKNLK